MKKVLALAGAGALVLSLVVPAMAFVFPTPPPVGKVEISNSARVNTNVSATANSGWNLVSGVFGGKVRTGDTVAGSAVETYVNQNKVSCPTCGGNVEITNRAKVTTNVSAVADTGHNMVMGGWCGRVSSGDGEAWNTVYTVVNSSVVGD